MRVLPIIAILFLATYTAQGQSQTVDSLVARLHNQLIQMDGDYFGPRLRLKDSTIALLIAEGKDITKQLLPLLVDTAKGIAAHFILTQIYLPRQELEFGYSKQYKADRVRLNKLLFYFKNEKVFALMKELKQNKMRWIAYFRREPLT
jgi:hypothetical protein